MSNTLKYYIWNGILLAIVIGIVHFTESSTGGLIFSVLVIAIFYRQRNPQIDYRGEDYDEQGRPYKKSL